MGKDIPEKGNDVYEKHRGRARVGTGGMFGEAGVWHENEDTLGDEVGRLLRARLCELS